MGLTLTDNEEALVQKLPQQWRGLLSLLLNRSAKHDQLMSMVAMRYRRQESQSTESWDQLLSSLSKKVPSVAATEELCFQSQLQCFPDLFIQRFLTFLLRFQDIVSADSLDRFLHFAPVETDSSLIQPLLEKLTSILVHRSGSFVDLSVAKNAENRTCDSENIKQSELEHVDEIDGAKAVQDRDASSKNGVTTCLTVPDKDAEPMELCEEIVVSDDDCFIEMVTNETAKNTELVQGRPSSLYNWKNYDNFVIILDSDEEDDGGNVKVKDDLKQEIVKQEQESHELQTANEMTRTGEASSCIGEAEQMSLDRTENSRLDDVVKHCADEAEQNGAGAEYQGHIQKLQEALLSGEGDSGPLDLAFLLAIPSSQVSATLAVLDWNSVGCGQLCAFIQQLTIMSEKLSHVTSSALVRSIIQSKYEGLEETPSRQMMSCLIDLTLAFPQQAVSSLCDLVQESSCNNMQSELVSTLCKSWQPETLTLFLRRLCTSDIQVDENLLTVIQCAVNKHPELNADTLTSVLHLLETGATQLAKSAKYGRLVLNFVKSYKSQMTSSHVSFLKSITSVHSSVIRKSLRSLVDSLPS